MLERFKDEIGQAVDYRKTGYLFILTNQADVNTFKRNVELQNRLGAMTQWLSADELRSRLPMMRLDDVIAGSFNPLDGLVDPNSVVMGYISASQRLGVKAYTSTPVIGIHVRSDKIIGIDTPNGTISTPIIVDATGPWSESYRSDGRFERAHNSHPQAVVDNNSYPRTSN